MTSVPSDRWRRVGTDLVSVRFDCHSVLIFTTWVMPDGRVSGRPQCSEAKCRKAYDDVTLEGWSA